jgi:Leucine-rich repeat (LRR) protein
MKNNRKIYILIALGAIVLLFAGYYLSNDKSLSLNSNSPAESNQPAIVETNPEAVKTDITVKTSASLDLSGRNLDKLDMSIFERSELESLNVSGNNLSGALPSQIGNLKNLKILNASNNDFTGVPAEVGRLSKLEILDLSNNNLTGLPYELGDLKNLKTFNISGNQFSEYDLNIIREKLPNTKFITN